MKNYWDLSEKERSALSREEVEQYLDAELMLKGVLKVEPLVEQKEPAIPAPRTTYYRIRHGGYQDLDCAFPTAEAAQAFLDSGVVGVQTAWLANSESVPYVQPLIKPTVVAVPLLTAEERNAYKSLLEQSAAARAANEKARIAQAAAIKVQDEALSGLWEDWQRCRERASKMEKIGRTIDDYKRIAGDAAIAARFLTKVYPVEEIIEAAAWLGIENPLVTSGAEAAA